MKRLVTVVLSLVLMCSVIFCNTAFAASNSSEIKTYTNKNAMIVIHDGKTDIREVLPNGDVRVLGFQNVRLCAFKPRYCCIIAEKDGTVAQGLWFFGKSTEFVVLEDYTPVFFDDDQIILKKGDTYYEVDMEISASTGILVVHPESKILPYDSATEIKTYGANNALVIVKGDKTVIYDVMPDGEVRAFAFANTRLTAFTPQYLAFIIESGKQGIWFWGKSTKMVNLEDYTPIFFDDDQITLKKGNTYYEVDMEKTSSTGELVVHPE